MICTREASLLYVYGGSDECVREGKKARRVLLRGVYSLGRASRCPPWILLCVPAGLSRTLASQPGSCGRGRGGASCRYRYGRLPDLRHGRRSPRSKIATVVDAPPSLQPDPLGRMYDKSTRNANPFLLPLHALWCCAAGDSGLGAELGGAASWQLFSACRGGLGRGGVTRLDVGY